MAARQDQTQTFALIITAILAFVMAILAYLSYRGYADAERRAADLSTQKQSSDNAAREMQGVNEQLQKMLGVGGATLADINTQFEEDQKRFMQNFDEGSRNYRSVLEYIDTENKKIAQQETEAKSREQDVKNRLTAVEAEKEAQIAKLDQELQKLRQDLESERTSFAADRKRLETERAALAKTLASTREDFEKKVANAQQAVTQAERGLADSERSRLKLIDERQRESPSFEVADGRVTYVNQATGTLWVNLGSADKLRAQVPFSVFESDLSDAAKADKKGSIEITRLLGEHLAEARITKDNARDPILPGDQIFSPVWERGKELRFALTGFIDLDGDGKSDLQQAKDLIQLAGATVDASLEEDGKVQGEMSVDTRYLVLGEYPDQPSRAAIRAGYDTMSKEASNKGVEPITVVDFLNQMGYEPVEKTAQFSGSRQSRGAANGPGRSFRFTTP